MTKRRKSILIVFATIIVLIAGAWVSLFFFNPFQRHQHCIKVSGSAFREYAAEHDGKFPYHTNGFGDALILLLKADPLGFGGTNLDMYIHYVTGPGDDGLIFKEALQNNNPIQEEECSRIYVQGLSETNNPQLAILFDKKSTRGGDHFRRPWGPLVREICMLTGSMMTIPEQDWLSFATNQIELLVQDGIPREVAKKYYKLP